MAATVRQVAKLANVSIGSVSRYLNGYEIKETTKEKIEHATKTLDYKVNYIAKGLKTSKTLSIGVGIDNFTDIFSTTIVAAAEKVLEANNYNLLLSIYDGKIESQDKKIRYMRDKMVDGMILYLHGQKLPILEELVANKFPVVIVNQDIENFECDKVLVNNFQITYDVVSKIMAKGHSRIGVIAGTKIDFTSKERVNGYLKALSDNNIKIEKSLIKYAMYSHEISYVETMKMIDSPNPPTAIFALSYHMTLGMMKAINERGIKIPEQLSIVGFDRFELSDVIKPSITLVEQPVDEIGKTAANLVLKRLKGDFTDYPQRIVLDAKIVDNDSIRTI